MPLRSTEPLDIMRLLGRLIVSAAGKMSSQLIAVEEVHVDGNCVGASRRSMGPTVRENYLTAERIVLQSRSLPVMRLRCSC